MPNHCLNTLTVSEDMAQTIVEKYISEDKNGEAFFDFDKIVPIGDVPDWYEQRMEKWGTKWNGYDLFIEESFVEFSTAWSPPVPIIQKLAELHKEYTFKLEYYEPGMAFRGVATAEWQDGEVLLDDQCWDMTEKDLEELGLSEPEEEDAFIMEETADDKKLTAAACSKYGWILNMWSLLKRLFRYGYEKAVEKAKATTSCRGGK